ncbi:hypothetical protein CVD28_01320 [Bacillus sp. M6-12]|uniref:DUF4317 family protein n=1 Tax=Bacillus sp. M6-12 TaxID=2054166 RepID=UPI000C788EA8|nr:DUF4317 family protein [Bacillus sp. M6-12]PLS19074.1 hypothetical protein CVD28_01320 [Bacillus sp. M6-12]
MNKKDIANIRKEFKVDNIMLKLKEVFHVYVQKETSNIVHSESQYFNMMELEEQELFMGNFKKILTGNLDEKVFELKFKNGVDNSTQTLLFDTLNTTDVDHWKEEMLKIVEKMYTDVAYEFDTVVSFVRGEYLKPTKKKKEEEDAGKDDEVFVHPFILCTINKTDKPKRAILFDYVEKEFKANSVLDAIINLNTPLQGFFFPAFNNNVADVNHILYSAGKKNQPDGHFIEEVLDCHEIVTAVEDKGMFDQVLRSVLGEKIESTEILSNIYEEIEKVIVEKMEDEESEVPMLDYHDMTRILEVSGVDNVDTDKLEHIFKDVVDDENYEFKASSLLPGKTVKINTKTASVNINTKDMKNIKQIINHRGKKCILIEVDEDVEIEGFTLESERL